MNHPARAASIATLLLASVALMSCNESEAEYQKRYVAIAVCQQAAYQIRSAAQIDLDARLMPPTGYFNARVYSHAMAIAEDQLQQQLTACQETN